MHALLVIALIVGSYFVGRIVQWIANARDAMGTNLRNNRRAR